MQKTPSPRPELAGLVESSDESERPSVTDVNGTVAHFEMAYNPKPNERFTFGPPILQRLPGFLFLGFAMVLGIATFVAHSASTNSPLYRFIVIENREPLVYVIVIAAIATCIRAGMLGVIVTRDGVETRTLSLGIPRVAQYRWAQIDRIVLDEESAIFELWNGSYVRLPRVRDARGLTELLERVAAARGRQVTRLDPKR